jgi:predicted aspartyl protease
MPPTVLRVALGKRSGQQLVATNAAGHLKSSRLFYVSDKNSKLQFLIDTGAEVSLLPASVHDRNNRYSGPSLQAANNSTIRTYGTRSLTLDLSLRRALPWVFTIADVSNPILGADFLQFYHLIVDIKHNKLIDTVTRLHIQGVCTPNSSPHPVWQPVQPSNSFTSLLAEFPSLTRPPSFSQTVSHSTTHTIHTKGLPI